MSCNEFLPYISMKFLLLHFDYYNPNDIIPIIVQISREDPPLQDQSLCTNFWTKQKNQNTRKHQKTNISICTFRVPILIIIIIIIIFFVIKK